MKIYTSYWAQVRNFPTNLVGLNTTVWPPKNVVWGKNKRGVICIDCPPFKPGIECDGLCNGKCNPKHPSDCDFLAAYRKQLNKLDCRLIISKMRNLAERIENDEGLKDVDFAFIVYEKWDNECSERWIIQDWFRENGVEIEEWKK